MVAKYGLSLGKAIYTLYTGDPAGIRDVALAFGNEKLTEWLKARDEAGKLKAICERVAAAVRDRYLAENGEEISEIVLEEVALTFDAGFSFDELVDLYGEPQRCASRWIPLRSQEPLLEGDDQRGQHDRLLMLTVNAVMAELPTLPGYHSWVVGRLRTTKDTTAKLEKLVTELQGVETAKFAKFENIYRASVPAKLDVVELFVEHPDIQKADAEQKLSVAYVSLNVAPTSNSDPASEPITAMQMLGSNDKKGSRCLVLGNAGSGKTTLLRWFALNAFSSAQRTDQNESLITLEQFSPEAYATELPDIEEEFAPVHLKMREQVRELNDTKQNDTDRNFPYLHSCDDCLTGRIPFFLRLRDYANADAPISFPTPDNYTAKLLTSHSAPSGWADSVFAEGRAILLIDGLDEVNSERREEALTWIRDVASGVDPNNHIIVTSRPQALPVDCLKEAGFTTYNVCDLQPKEQALFVEYWHKAVRQRLTKLSAEIDELFEKEQILLRELTINEDLSILARNPLLAALICALNRISRDELPKNLFDLCDASVRMLLWGRDRLQHKRQALSPPAYEELSYERRRIILRNIAYKFVTSGTERKTRAAILFDIREWLHDYSADGEVRAQEIYSGIVERSNLLREAGDQEVEFVHNYFRDFLASIQLVLGREEKMVVDRFLKEGGARWMPIMEFMVASAEDDQASTRLIDALLRPGSIFRKPSETATYTALILWGRTRLPISADLLVRLKTLFDKYIPANTPARVHSIGKLGSIAINYLKRSPDQEFDVQIASIKALLSINTSKSLAELRTYAESAKTSERALEIVNTMGVDVFTRFVNLLEIPIVAERVMNGETLEFRYAQAIGDLTPIQSGLHSSAKLDLGFFDLDGIRALEDCVNLRELRLVGTRVSDITPLLKLRLHSLAVSAVYIGNLEAIGEIESLTTLEIDCLEIREPSQLKAVVALQHKRHLHIRMTRLSIELEYKWNISRLFSKTNIEFAEPTSVRVAKILGRRVLQYVPTHEDISTLSALRIRF